MIAFAQETEAVVDEAVAIEDSLLTFLLDTPLVQNIGLGLLVFVVLFILALAYWTYRDVRQRSRRPATWITAVLLVLVFNIPGVILYLLLRPLRTLREREIEALELELLKEELADEREDDDDEDDKEDDKDDAVKNEKKASVADKPKKDAKVPLWKRLFRRGAKKVEKKGDEKVKKSEKDDRKKDDEKKAGSDKSEKKA